MKKIVFRFWGINLLISILLFFAYRISISQTVASDGNSFEQWMQIVEILLNLGFSLIYLIGMAIFSLAVLLNLVEKIRNNIYLSLLTFLGLPCICVIIIIIKLVIDISFNDFALLRTFTIFSILYLFLTTIEFLLFRKRINKELNK
ncbi:hypothetical protein [Chryseobacterium indoltheticum]|uniref:hypothetical protein n=1 Tax=Chryseobacterium indoltheticum TaxID=254 RepID=UPI001912240B|nr:hypothetical protein [Chryseobacterium indoltheticum]QQQ30272.1 hypothetical protein JJL46_09875 [Chryseobacterium indoltheticum]